jgi:phosphoenolpyruvate carboxykinase (GTP)
MPDSFEQLSDWVERTAQKAQPERVQWCDGSEQEWEGLKQEMLKTGHLHTLNPETFPECYLHRSHPDDVARVEHLTYICTPRQEEAGPNNRWMPPQEAHERFETLFAGCMKGRTLYVIPYCMGPLQSPWSQLGVEITDSPYVVANMRLMTRMDPVILKRIHAGENFVRGEHSVGNLNPEQRYILHFPQENLIQSIGSGYGGNALLSKKCHSLRIASWQARQEGWMAEHMLIVGVQPPDGETYYLAAAFPSACGKTNLSMLVPPETFRGWKVWTVGDDIAWLHIGADGRLWAVNPEAGYFGVVPGTNAKTNPNAYQMIHRQTIYTNVAVTAENEPWWEGLPQGQPVVDWQGRPYQATHGPAAHPNSRFTTRSRLNPAWSPHSEDPQGVPISAILFGGRRPHLVPLVLESKNWIHGVLMGCGLASETTAAASGKTGVVRRDPMAMLPFCGYHFGDYWTHWLSMQDRATRLPRIFQVNWFRQDRNGRYLWPGYGENLRVIQWILERCKGTVPARETPVGYLPEFECDLNLGNLDVPPEALQELFFIDAEAWKREYDDLGNFFSEYSPRVPAALQEQLAAIRREL